MNKRIMVIILTVPLALNIFSAECFSGTSSTTGAIIMKETVGARQLGMGEAFTAVADDVNTLAYNPAGLANLKDIEIGAMHLMGLAGSSSEFVGVSLPLGDMGKLGVSLTMLNGGEMEINTTADDGSILSNESKNAQTDTLITMGLGRDFGENLSVGATFKLISSKLVEEYTASSSAVDIGGLYRLIYEDVTEFTVGGSLQNFRLGDKLKYQDDSTSDADADELPRIIRAGAMYLKRFGGYYGDSNSFTVAADVLLPNDSSIMANAGFEYIMEAMGVKLAFRGGVKYNYGPSIAAMTGGIGIAVNSFQFDFGIGPMGSIGSMIRGSFTAKFGSKKETKSEWY